MIIVLHLHVFYILSLTYIFQVEVWIVVPINMPYGFKSNLNWNSAIYETRHKGQQNGPQIISHARLCASTQHAIRHLVAAHHHAACCTTICSNDAYWIVNCFYQYKSFLILLIQTHIPPQIAYTLCSQSTAWHLYIVFKTLYCRTEEHFYRATKVDAQIVGCD